MICPKCNTMNPNSIKKCIKCGEKLEKAASGAAKVKPASSGPMLKRDEKPAKQQKAPKEPKVPKPPKPEGEKKSKTGILLLLLLLLGSFALWQYRDDIFTAMSSEETVEEIEEDEDVELFVEERVSRRDSLLYSSLSDTEKAQRHRRLRTYDENFYYAKDGKRMVLVPGESFQMGSDDGSILEKPAHTVRVVDFYMDETEVTNLQFKRFLEETDYRPKGSLSHFRDRRFNRDDHPVVNVDYEDALAYAQWAGKRLPTEVEWEAAARGGQGFIYPTGEDMTENQARFGMNITVGTTMPVKSYRPNPYGIYDLAGNASEWVQGVIYPYPGNDAHSRYFGSARVPRGGSWLSSKEDCKSYRRAILDISSDLNNIGFRCAISRDEVIELLNRQQREE